MDQIPFGISVFLLLLEDTTSELWGAIYGALLFCFFHFPSNIIWFNDDCPVKAFLFWKETVKEKKKTNVNFCSHKLMASMISKLE